MKSIKQSLIRYYQGFINQNHCIFHNDEISVWDMGDYNLILIDSKLDLEWKKNPLKLFEFFFNDFNELEKYKSGFLLNFFINYTNKKILLIGFGFNGNIARKIQYILLKHKIYCDLETFGEWNSDITIKNKEDLLASLSKTSILNWIKLCILTFISYDQIIRNNGIWNYTNELSKLDEIF